MTPGWAAGLTSGVPLDADELICGEALVTVVRMVTVGMETVGAGFPDVDDFTGGSDLCVVGMGVDFAGVGRTTVVAVVALPAVVRPAVARPAVVLPAVVRPAVDFGGVVDRAGALRVEPGATAPNGPGARSRWPALVALVTRGSKGLTVTVTLVVTGMGVPPVEVARAVAVARAVRPAVAVALVVRAPVVGLPAGSIGGALTVEDARRLRPVWTELAGDDEEPDRTAVAGTALTEPSVVEQGGSCCEVNRFITSRASARVLTGMPALTWSRAAWTRSSTLSGVQDAGVGPHEFSSTEAKRQPRSDPFTPLNTATCRLSSPT